MQDFVQNLIEGIGSFFGSMYSGAPTLWGSKYPVFLLELLILIVVFDLIIFGWRPLVRRFLPDSYHAVNYYFAQSVNVLAFLVLVIFNFYLGAQLGDTWGSWIGISGLIWTTAAILAVMVLTRFLTKMTSAAKSKSEA